VVTVAEFFKEYGFVVGALTGSLAAYLLGLLVSHFRREKRWLGFSIDSRNIVRAEHSDLSISFKGHPIAGLDSHTVLLRNVGNRPLTRIPVKIVADQTAMILEQKMRCPDGIDITGGACGGSEILFGIDLLNQKETVRFDLTVSDSLTGELNMISRMEGVRLIELNSRSISTDDMIHILEDFPFYGDFLSKTLRFSARVLKIT
jgi:hypothetical protein